MSLIFLLLQNDTEPDLWVKCMELHEDCAPVQQGGPLMSCLILRRIQDQSEQALVVLVQRVSRIDISKTVGEDIESAMRLVKSAHRALSNSSASARSCAPIDFNKTALIALQTASVEEFNEVFQCMLRDCQTQADQKGISPIWPDLSAILALAKNAHSRLKHSGAWDAETKRSQAHNAITSAPQRSPGVRAARRSPKCWNCGGPHSLPQCPKPRDIACIELARSRHQAAQASHPRRQRGKPRHKTDSDGGPLVSNGQGLCALDQKKWRRMSANLSAASDSDGNGDGDSPAAATGAEAPLGQVARRAQAIRSALSPPASL